MSSIPRGFVRRTIRGIAVSSTRSCAIQSSGKQIDDTFPIPFGPRRALRGRSGILIRYGMTPAGTPGGPIFVQGTRLAGGGGFPAGPATAVSYPIRGLIGDNNIKTRRIARVFLPLTGNVPVFVSAGGSVELVGTIESE